MNANKLYCKFIQYQTIILNDDLEHHKWMFHEQLLGVCRTQKLTIYIESSDTTLHLKSGELFYIAAGQTFIIDRITYSACRLHLILFDFEVGSEEQGGASLPMLRQQIELPMIHRWLDDFEWWNKYRQMNTFFRIQSHIYSILTMMSQGSEQSVEENITAEQYIVQVKREMETDYSQSWDMIMLVRQSKMSESRFYQLFRLLTGHSPLRFIRQIRLQAALQLLAARGMSVTEVAHQIGYSDELYFSRIFKKYIGITPTEYATKTQMIIVNLCAVFSGDFAVLGLEPQLTLNRYWGKNEAISMELIKKTHPDLIFAGMFEDEADPEVVAELKRKLADIATFETIAWKRYSWKHRLREIASRLELSLVADSWLNGYEQKITNSQQLIKRVFGTEPILLVCVRDGEFWLFGAKAGKVSDLYYDDLGAGIPAAVSDTGMKEYAGIDDLAQLCCKHIILIVEDDMFDADMQYQFKQTWSEWQGERDSHCMVIALGEWFSYNALMHDRLLDMTTEQLLGLVYR